MPPSNHTVARTRKAVIVAQDPAFRDADGKIITAEVELPDENFEPGPWGYRVHVIDYDAASDRLFMPLGYAEAKNKAKPSYLYDKKKDVTNSVILNDPRFHAGNAYVIVMRTLARFEKAMGRRVSWGFYGHQLKVVPHAFDDANAFYSTDDQALLFGHFQGGEGRVFTCLSHDVIAHECTHALVDGLRPRYMDPSSPDQAAFHEGFADVVALLSVFAVPEVVEQMLRSGEHVHAGNRVAAHQVTIEALREGAITGLADQVGSEISAVRGQPLRRSTEIVADPSLYKSAEFREPHRRGELLVAAIVNAFLEVWTNRIKSLGSRNAKDYDLTRVVGDGAEAADHLLTTCIRALDYCPPVHLTFSDYLSAALTADAELHTDDDKYGFRDTLRTWFGRYGIKPTSKEGVWARPGERGEETLRYDRIHPEAMSRDRDEMFRFVWENKAGLRLTNHAYSRVLSVRPCVRVDWDGFVLHETVAEVMQILKVRPKELRVMKIKVPKGMTEETEVTLYGGNTLVFDEYGRLKFNIHNRIDNEDLQSDRLKYLWETGFFSGGGGHGFDALHRARAVNAVSFNEEAWL